MRHRVACIRFRIKSQAEAIGLTVTLTGGLEELVERCNAGAAHSLICAHCGARKTKAQMQWPDCKHERDSRAVWIRDQPHLIRHEVVVPAGRYQRHFGIRAKGVALVA